MPGTRKYESVDETTTKVTIIVPKDIDRELRLLAARQGMAVGLMIRGWLIEKLRHAPETSVGDPNAAIYTDVRSRSRGESAA